MGCNPIIYHSGTLWNVEGNVNSQGNIYKGFLVGLRLKKFLFAVSRPGHILRTGSNYFWVFFATHFFSSTILICIICLLGRWIAKLKKNVKKIIYRPAEWILIGWPANKKFLTGDFWWDISWLPKIYLSL